MGDLVLRTRVAVTKRNLRRIQDLHTTLTAGGAGLREFLDLPDSLQEELETLLDQCNELAGRARRFREEDPGLPEGIRSLANQLEIIYTNLDKSRKAAAVLQLERLRFVELRNDLRVFLARSAEEKENSLTVSNYFKNRDEIESLFSEYVDVLRGIALRSAGFRDGDSQLNDIFLIAEQLPRLWSRKEGWDWHSLAVPSRSELNRKSQAFTLRIGFPEWTLWALPFAQYQFAHVFVARVPGLAPTGARAQYEAALLADALATVVTGPAYACAALLLRLDPAAVTSPEAEAAARSATIVVTLAQIAKIAGTPPLDTLTERLRTEWSDAIGAAGGDPGAFDTAMKDAAAETRAGRALVAALGSGPGGAPKPPAWAERWATINVWADQLRDGRADKVELRGVGDNGDDEPLALAFLLNAAWLARVRPNAEADSPEDGLDAIAAGTIENMLQVVRDAAEDSSSRSDLRPGRRRNP
jgi:hypothetical protein